MQGKKNELYAAYVSDLYSNLNSFDTKAYETCAHTIVNIYGRFLPADKSASILDVGCGAGYFLYALKSCGYNNVTGIDLSEEQVNLARKIGLNASCQDGFAYLEHSESKYDFIISTDLLEHLTRDEVIEYASLVHKALKPDGCFLAAVPNANSPFAARLRYKDLTHEQSFTEESLRQLFLRGGFTPEFIGGERIPPESLQAYARVAVSAIFRTFWRAFMIAEIGKEAFGVPIDFKLIGVGKK